MANSRSRLFSNWRRALRAGVYVAGLSCLPLTAQQQALPLETQSVLRITAREAVLDVVARDRHNNPVDDLVANEMQVFELQKHGRKAEQRILSMQIVDPHKDASHAGTDNNGFRISTGAVCALNATTRYQLAIPASPEPGYHEIQVITARPQVRLSFRRRYFVGKTAATVEARKRGGGSDWSSLARAACLHPQIPPSMVLTAHPIAGPGEGMTRYVLTVRPQSLIEIGLDGSNLRVQLDYGVCIFNAEAPAGIFQYWTLDPELSAEEMEQAQARGLKGLAVTPRENSFCGDVYELPEETPRLPDFWDLDPVGSIYTDSLNVPNQQIFATDSLGAPNRQIIVFQGIPGVTFSPWFGVDYYGEFYITKPGEYAFELQSDDGSRLEIDNQMLLDIDGTHPVLLKTAQVNLTAGLHTIHVPYMQTLPNHLALGLRIQPPGESMRLFNLNEFAPRRTSPAALLTRPE